MQATAPGKTYCTETCRKKSKGARQYNSKNGSPEPRVCEACGGIFLARPSNKKRKYCGDAECKKKRESERYLRWKKDHPERARSNNLRYQYGITIDDFEKMLEAQRGCCAICGEPPAQGKKLVVDHCHQEGHVRALLCNACNTGIGLFEERPERLIAAARWLTAQKEKVGLPLA